MGTAVLRSHDPFLHVDSFGSRTPPPTMKPSRRKALRSGAASPSTPVLQSRPRRQPASLPPPVRSRPSPAPRAGGRRVTFADKENGASNAMVVRFPTHNLVMEKVKILKRGEEPVPPPTAVFRSDAVAFSGEAGISPLFSTGRLGPEPEILPKQIVFSEPRLAASPLAPRRVDETLGSQVLSTALQEIQPKQMSSDHRSNGGISSEDKRQQGKQISFSVPSPVAYAGPAYINSPSPSAVPFPASFMSKAGLDEAANRASRELATRNLRGLLRLGNAS